MGTSACDGPLAQRAVRSAGICIAIREYACVRVQLVSIVVDDESCTR